MDYEMAVPHEVSGFHSFVTDIYIKQSDHTLKLQCCFLNPAGIAAPASVLHQLYFSVFKNNQNLEMAQKPHEYTEVM